MKKLSNTETDLKKSIAYKKIVYTGKLLQAIVLLKRKGSLYGYFYT